MKKDNPSNKTYWGGLKPNQILEKYIAKLPKGKALDIGAGGGRNSIFLAENGFEVEAIDKNEAGLKKIEGLAKEYGLKIKTRKCDISKFKFGKNKYVLVIATHSLEFLRKNNIDLILNKIKTSLKPEGFIYISVVSIEDPMYQLLIEKGFKQIEKNTFYLPKYNIYRHFFTKNELKDNFKDFEIVLLKQKQILDKGHGEPHYHNIIELLAKKEKTAD